MKEAGSHQLELILSHLRKVSNFGLINQPQRASKKEQHGNKTSTQHKGPLDSDDFTCVKNCFDEMFRNGMDKRFGNVDIIKGICSLVMHANEKRSRQFVIAIANSVMDTYHPSIVGQKMEEGIRRFQHTTQPQLKSSGVEALIEKLHERIDKAYGKAA